MRITYTGPLDAVEIAETGQVAKRGEPVDVADELGARLTEQECWTEDRPATRQKASN